jgi:hypothetical protein
MTLIAECNRPFQWRPWIYRSETMVRFGYAWFAIAYSRLRLDELMKLLFVET